MYALWSVAVLVLPALALALSASSTPQTRDYEDAPWLCTRRWGNIQQYQVGNDDIVWWLDTAQTTNTPTRSDFSITDTQSAAGIFLIDFCEDYKPTYMICLNCGASGTYYMVAEIEGGPNDFYMGLGPTWVDNDQPYSSTGSGYNTDIWVLNRGSMVVNINWDVYNWAPSLPQNIPGCALVPVAECSFTWVDIPRPSWAPPQPVNAVGEMIAAQCLN